MKKLIVLALAALMLVSCGKPAGNGGDGTESKKEVTTQGQSDVTTNTEGEMDKINRADPNGDGVFSLLTVGNSFSDDAMEYMYDIAESAGIKKIHLGNLYFGACRIEQHYKFWSETDDKRNKKYDYRREVNGKGWVTGEKHSDWKEALDDFNWDYICFQESAQEIQTNESLYVHLQDLMDMAHERCPGALFIYHMPWPNPHANYGNSIDKMYADCMKALDTIIDKYGFFEVITTGTAIQNLRTSYIGYDKTVRDGWHLSYGVGRYTAGLAFFTQLTGISVENLEFKPGRVQAEEKIVAIEAAMNSAACRRAVTQSQYTEKPKI